MTPISQDKLDELLKELQTRVAADFAGVCYPPRMLLEIVTELRELRVELSQGLKLYSSPDSTGTLFEWDIDHYPGATHCGVLIRVDTLPKDAEVEK